jgi:hypothetical protein
MLRVPPGPGNHVRDFLLICFAGAVGTGAHDAVSTVATILLGARFAVGTLALGRGLLGLV